MENVIDVIDTLVDIKYKDTCYINEKHLKKADFYNIIVKLKPSAYHNNIASAILCRVYNDCVELAISRKRFDDINSYVFKEAINKEISALFAFPSFGCCHKYIECSDKKMCVHNNLFYSSACLYLKNLEAGKIFYGINKNV